MPTAVDRQQFLRLLEQHGGILRKVAASYSRTSADRHDLMQEIRLQLWRAYPKYSPDRPVSTWMYRIALNVAISFVRRAGHSRRQSIPLEESDLEWAGESSTPQAEPDERLVVLRKLIDLLDPLNRALLLLYLDERSYREIGEILGLSETNVATKLSRLKERLRRDLSGSEGD